MTSLLYIAVCLWMFVSKVISVDFVLPNQNDELMYTCSELFPRQISVINSTTNVGVVVDSIGDRLALFNGETGLGVIIDKGAGIGIEIEHGGWLLYQNTLQDYLKDCNLSQIVDENAENVFELEDQGPSAHSTTIAEGIVTQLSTDFLSQILSVGNLFMGIIKIFGLIMHPIKNVLGPVLNMISPVWAIFKGGFMGLLNIFKWMGKFMSSILGGLPLLLQNAVQFSLSVILGALSGIKVLFALLKVLAGYFNLIALLKPILTQASQIVKFIVGLGGQMLRGLTGIFGIIGQLFSFSVHSITIALKQFTGVILSYLREPPPTYEDFGQSVDELLTIPEEQEQRYQNKPEFDEYTNFLKGVKGENEYKVEGVSVGPFVQAITQTTNSAKAVIVNVLGQMTSIAPLNTTVPQLLVSLVKSLNSTDGHSYVKEIIPTLDIPKEGLDKDNKNIAGRVLRSGNSGDSLDDLKDLPATDLLKQLPVVSQIYKEIDEATRKYYNTSLDSLLQDHHKEELVEFTTKALGLVQ